MNSVDYGDFSLPGAASSTVSIKITAVAYPTPSFNEALIAFGYRLSQQFVTLLYRTYDRDGRNALSFDLFVQACISLKRMTDVFKKYDEDRDGYITLSFEEFLTEIIRQR